MYEFAAAIFLLWGTLFLISHRLLAPSSAIWLTNGLTLALFTAGLMTFAFMEIGIVKPENMVDWLVYETLICINVFVMPFLYWWDKRRASVEGAWRIPENILHGFAFIGGAPSALLCQYLFRHKTQKRYFRLITIFGLVTSIGIFYLVLFELDFTY